ncbi:MAG: sugar transferase, partial [Actinomycetota bacterium]|nr:sugar transferase [Actinomycetota bacterium]
MTRLVRVPLPRARGRSFLRYFLLGLDAAALTFSWVIATVVVTASARSVLASLLSTIVLVVGGLAVFRVIGLYRARICNLRAVEYVRVARGCLIIALLGLAVAAVTGSIVAPGEIALGTTLAFLLVTVLRGGYRTWLTNRRRVGRYLRPVLLVGAGAESAEVAALLAEHPELGYRTAGVVGDEREARRHGLEVCWCGRLDEGLAVLADMGVSGAIVCGSDLHSSELNRIVQELLRAGAHVQLSTGLHSVDVGRLRPSPLAHEPFFYVEPVTLAAWQLVTKRVIDVVLSSAMLALALPVLGLAALGIKIHDRGPVLFKQWRVGRDGAPFLLYKLRTMREDAEHETADLFELNVRDGPLTKFRQDPRVTMLGRILRATSIDELPQLWNVLNGTMSLVGPRPALPDEVANFDAELRARESVWPGITGLWQVEGRDNPSFAAYRRFDLFYLENWSVALDLVILLGTVESIVARACRSLLHRGEDISLAPPEVQDPGREAPRAARRNEPKTESSA